MAQPRNRMTFAGRPFRLVSERAREHVDRYYPLAHLHDVADRRAGKNLNGLSLPRTPAISPRLNDFYYPATASHWACFRGLMTGEDAAAAEALAFAGLTSTPQEFLLEAGGVSVSTSLYLLPPRPVADLADDPRGHDSLRLVTLVCERYYWAISSAGELDFSGATTWADLVSALAATLGVTITLSAVDAAYGIPEPDSALYSHHESPAAILDAVCHSLGGVLCRSFDGTYTIQRWAAAHALALAGGLGEGGQAGGTVLPFDPAASSPARAAVLPKWVYVTFPRYVADTGYEHPAPDHRSWADDSYPTVHTEEVETASLGAPYDDFPTVDTVQPVHTTAKAVVAVAGDVTVVTAAECAALAVRVAKDVLDRQCSAADVSYPGVYAHDPLTAHDALFAWSGAGKPYTRLSRGPWNASPLEVQHGFTVQTPRRPPLAPASPAANAVPAFDAAGDLANTPVQVVQDVPSGGVTVTIYETYPHDATTPAIQFVLDPNSGDPKQYVTFYPAGTSGTPTLQMQVTADEIRQLVTMGGSTLGVQFSQPGADEFNLFVGDIATQTGTTNLFVLDPGTNAVTEVNQKVQVDGGTTTPFNRQYTQDGTATKETLTGESDASGATLTGYGGSGGRTEGAVAAAGTTQGTATAITTDAAHVTGANSVKGVILPSTTAGLVVVWNDASIPDALKVYPPVGAQFASGIVNQEATQNAGTIVLYSRITSTVWSYVSLVGFP